MPMSAKHVALTEQGPAPRNSCDQNARQQIHTGFCQIILSKIQSLSKIDHIRSKLSKIISPFWFFLAVAFDHGVTLHASLRGLLRLLAGKNLARRITGMIVSICFGYYTAYPVPFLLNHFVFLAIIDVEMRFNNSKVFASTTSIRFQRASWATSLSFTDVSNK